MHGSIPTQALLTTGLSAEYSRKASEAASAQKDDEPVESSSIAAKYYINQILTMDEASIQQAWMKVRPRASGAVRGARAGAAPLTLRLGSIRKPHV